ncbi:cyanoexosortase A [Limnospira sp. PMC 917.15]|uniref:cyanoexosortase A n=1 Tax=Limnospira sp. PMC 917.15 TaxID=2981106 RepID=UPI0028E0CACD|nr:cyanoexosortase A [Limnospira sp. PMC 917.15]
MARVFHHSNIWENLMMNTPNFLSIQSWKQSEFWLMAIAAGLMSIHLTLIYHRNNVSFLALSIMFWLSASSLVWEKIQELAKQTSSPWATLLGMLIIAIVLLKSATRPTSNWLGISPFISALGWTLIASGFSGFREYWRELTILFFLGVPKVFIWPLVDISGITAKFAALILWYAGANVSLDKFNVMLPEGGVSVNMGCSGLEGMFYLLGLSVLFLVMFPLEVLWKKIIIPVVAVLISFVVNGFRIVLLAVLANAQKPEAVDYWHVGEGSLIFSMISVALFGCFCWFMIKQDTPPTNQDTLSP